MCFRGIDTLGEIDPSGEATRYPYMGPLVGFPNDFYLNREAGKVVTRDRECEKWMAYQQGLDPIVHMNSKALSDLEEDRRVFARNLEATRDEQDRRNRRFDLTLTIAAIFLALMQVLSAGDDAGLVRIVRHITGWPPAAEQAQQIPVPQPQPQLPPPQQPAQPRAPDQSSPQSTTLP